MASKPITHQADLTTSASYGFAASLARMLAAVIWHDIRVLEGQTRRPAGGAARPRPLAA
jgi:hypothetical protein